MPNESGQRKNPPTASPMWEERCLPEQRACDWWLRDHEDKAHAVVADEVDETGMVTNYPSYTVGVVVRLFNDTAPGDAIRVLEGYCPWHNDRLDQGRCIDLPNDLSEAGPALSAYSRSLTLSWSAGTDGTGTWIAGRWADGVDYVYRRWVFDAAEIRALSMVGAEIA